MKLPIFNPKSRRINRRSDAQKMPHNLDAAGPVGSDETSAAQSRPLHARRRRRSQHTSKEMARIAEAGDPTGHAGPTVTPPVAPLRTNQRSRSVQTSSLWTIVTTEFVATARMAAWG